MPKHTIRPAVWRKLSVMPLKGPQFFHIMVEKLKFMTFEEKSIWRPVIFTQMKQLQGIALSFMPQGSFKLS